MHNTPHHQATDARRPDTDDTDTGPTAIRHRDRLRAVTDLAATQDGCVEYSQLRGFGLSRWTIARWVDTGLLRPVARRVFSVGHVPGSLSARVRQATLTAPAHAVISHGLACEWMDLRTPTHGRLELLIARGRPRPQPGVVFYRTRHLPPSDLRTSSGVRHTSVARSLYDVSARASSGELDRLLDRAAKLRTLELIDLRRVMDERPRLRGRPALEAAISRLGASLGRSRSELERRAVELCRLAGVDTPVVNGLRAGEEVDLSWDWTAAIVELDGFEFHRSPADVQRAARKLAVLRTAGLPVLHFSWFDVTQRAMDTAARLRAFTERHRHPA